MNTEDKELLNTVLSKLEFQFIKDILVKPLPEEYIEKEITKPINTGETDEMAIRLQIVKQLQRKYLQPLRKV